MSNSTRRPSVRPNKPAKTVPSAPDTFPERGLKIGEAATLLHVETYVLRFWETQFPFLKPKHSRSKHRFYQQRDIEVLRVIQRLLHDEGFTIAGANKYIKEVGLEALIKGSTAPKASRPAADGRTPQDPESERATRRVLTEVRRDLQDLHKLLKD
jgi:DNA-binding transcriptional MerR regulator